MGAFRIGSAYRQGGIVLLAAILSACVIPSAIAVDAVPHYHAVSLGALGGSYSWALGINDHGAVTGAAASAAGGPRAFVHDGTSMRPVGDPWLAEWSYGHAISNAGHVAGYAIDGLGRDRAFLIDPSGAVRDVGTLGGNWARAYGVNASGEVVGVSRTTNDPSSRAFRYRSAAMTDIGTLGGSYGIAYGVNAAGTITGVAATRDGPGHAFVHVGGVMIDLGTLGGATSVGTAINDRGQVTGHADTTPPPGLAEDHAFLFPDPEGGGAPTMKDLGTLGGFVSRGRGINLLGQVVGESQTGDLSMHAFLYAAGAMRDLNALVVSGLGGRTLTEARAINDAGQIAANSCSGRAPYDCVAFRLDPVSTPLAIEYHHAEYGHYFVTSVPGEVASLDSGDTVGWMRTGGSFRTYGVGTPGTTPVCRFWSGQTYQPKSSHHYAPQGWACAVVLVNRDWVYEGNVFAVKLPDEEGGCVDGTTPLYQLYNNGAGNAPNHRYTTGADVRREMLDQGWTAEGVGPGVIGCVPE